MRVASILWMRSLRIAAAFLAALVGSAAALAWGEAGHRITGLVAEKLLTPEARIAVRTLMGTTDLGTISLYMDKQKMMLAQRIPGSREWHYDDRPVCDKEAKRPSYCLNGNCASIQIARHYRALIDQHSSVDERRFAVQVLVHLVGDIHQPLHASDHDDRGGNDIRVEFPLPGGGTKRTNLHSAWDTEFVKLAFDTADERVIARRLVDGANQADIKTWQKGGPNAWLTRSYERSQELAYGLLPGFNQCQTPDFDDERLVLDADYVAKATTLIPEQLLVAGARIAYLLNRAFAK